MAEKPGHRRANCSYNARGQEQWTLDGVPIKEQDIPINARIRGCPPRAAAIAAKEKLSPGRAVPAKALPAIPPKKGAPPPAKAATPKAAAPVGKKILAIPDKVVDAAMREVLSDSDWIKVRRAYTRMMGK